MLTSLSGKKLLVIASGDPSGIGPEITLKALAKFKLSKKQKPIVIGDYDVFKRNAKILNIKIPENIHFVDLKNVSKRKFKFGKIDPDYGRASMEYVSFGVSIVERTKNASLVTAPINKESIKKAGYNVGGHTEFLAKMTKSKNVTMMLVGGGLRTSLVTRHLPLKNVARSLTKEKIVITAQHTYSVLKNRFNIRNPRIGVAGLNPHAGEGGYFGKEEERVIKPALAVLKRQIKKIKGPISPDTLFYKAYRGDFDATVCMYHDQALIPLKMVAFERGVNLTIGIPFIRTSPDHGTGFDIAGKKKANPSSMVEAIKLATRLQ